MTLQGKLKWFGASVATVCTRTYHYTKAANAAIPYAVWAEDSETDSYQADNRKVEQFVSGSLNYFTKTEFDSVIDDIQDLLDINRVGWNLESVQYESDTGIIHYEWRWVIGETKD